jgi:hypothetical protein
MYSTFRSMSILEFMNFCIVISVTGSLHEVRFPHKAFQERMAGKRDVLYVGSTVALPVKQLFQYLSHSCAFKCGVCDIVCSSKHLRGFSRAAF